MATPMFFTQKIGVLVSNNVIEIPFYVVNGAVSIVTARIRDIATGEILIQSDYSASKITDQGIYTKCKSRININILLTKGIKQFQIQLKVNNSNWSPAAIINVTSAHAFVFSGINSLDSNDYYITGELQFTDSSESDQLESYSLELFEITRGNSGDISSLIEQTNILTPLGVNQIYYEIQKPLNLQKTHNVRIKYKTKKGYEATQTESLSFSFVVPDTSSSSNENMRFIQRSTPTITRDQTILSSLEINRWGLEGFVDLLRNATLYLDRTSSESNFSKWEAVTTYAINLTTSNFKCRLFFVVRDFFPSFGVDYKYRLRLQYYDHLTLKQISSQVAGPFIYDSEDVRLDSPNGDRYSIRYNPTISSLKYNTQDQVSTTLGGKYPFISMDGLTSQHYNLTNSIEQYVTTVVKPDVLNNATVTSHDESYANIIQERIFRDKVLSFLQEDEVKLFRSETEGTMLVKLSNINLTPNQQLGRRIWSFTATATEVAEVNTKTLEKYNFTKSYIGRNATHWGDIFVEGIEDNQVLWAEENQGELYMMGELKWTQVSNSNETIVNTLYRDDYADI